MKFSISVTICLISIRHFSSTYRAVFLRLVSLGVLLFTMWRQITCEGDTNNEACKLCQYNYKDYPVIILLECRNASSSQTGWKDSPSC